MPGAALADVGVSLSTTGSVFWCRIPPPTYQQLPITYQYIPVLHQTPAGRAAPIPVTESQNHRMVGVGRDLCGSSSPTLLPKQ